MDWLAGLRSVLDKPDVLWSGIGTSLLLAALPLLIARFRKPNAASIRQDASDWLAKNRKKLLARFQDELTTRKKAFLFNQTPLELGKILAPEQVEHQHSIRESVACILERNGVPAESMEQPVTALFNSPEVGRRLAILGKPGSGKTVCLLTLFEHLLRTAQDNDASPLPVIFECSEWDSRALPDWMAWQLHRKHHFPEDTARQLVQADDIFPLFDGLDELAAAKQGDFVRQFNAFSENRDVAICCREQEYRHLRESAGQKLALSNAAILQDIAPARLEEHLRQQGLDELWNLLVRSESEANSQTLRRRKGKRRLKAPQNLLQLARQPLFLGLMIAVADELRQGSRIRQGETWEDCIWRIYLDLCLHEKQSNRNQSPDLYRKRYSQQQSLHWLHCLAKWMQAENKVALQIDELQPSMLEEYWRFGLLYGLLVGVAFGLVMGLFTTPVIGAVFWLAVWLLIGLIFIVRADNDRITIEALRPLRFPASWQDVKAFSAKLSRWLFLGLAVGLLLGLVAGFVKTGKIVHGPVLAVGLAAGLHVGLLAGLAVGLKEVAGPLNETVHPQQRLKDALRSSLLLFPLFVLVAMLLFIQVLFSAERLGIAVGPFFKIQGFYVALFTAAIISFFALGTNAVLQHYLLRLCLCREGQLPLRLVPWLAAMHQRKVLQRVGGSYHFLHKQLQEYLAKQIGHHAAVDSRVKSG